MKRCKNIKVSLHPPAITRPPTTTDNSSPISELQAVGSGGRKEQDGRQFILQLQLMAQNTSSMQSHGHTYCSHCALLFLRVWPPFKGHHTGKLVFGSDAQTPPLIALWDVTQTRLLPLVSACLIPALKTWRNSGSSHQSETLLPRPTSALCDHFT